MSARLIDALARRSPRERRLLALLVGVALPAALWAGVVAPLCDAHAASAAALAEARALEAWVAARGREMAAIDAPGGADPVEPVGLSGLEQSLIAARLRAAATDLADSGAGGATLAFETVEFAALMRWLGEGLPGWGYALDGLRLRATDTPGLVTAEIRLVPRG